MDYTFAKTEVSKEKIQAYSKLLSAVFTDTKKYTFEYLDWQYNQNPTGKVVGCDAFYNGELIAHYVALPVEYMYDGRPVKGILALNVATHNDHRGKGLFTKLADTTYKYGEEEGYKFVTGVANQNTTSGYIKRLGFKIVSPLDVYIFSGGVRTAKVSDSYFRELWSPEKVQWRLKNPEMKYAKNNGCIMSPTHIGPIQAILSEREEFRDAAGLPEKESLLKMTIGLNMQNSDRLLKFSLPDKLKPSPLNLIFKTLRDFKAKVNRENTFFELSDFDAY